MLLLLATWGSCEHESRVHEPSRPKGYSADLLPFHPTQRELGYVASKLLRLSSGHERGWALPHGGLQMAATTIRAAPPAGAYYQAETCSFWSPVFQDSSRQTLTQDLSLTELISSSCLPRARQSQC